MLGAALLLLIASIISASNLLLTRALQRRYEIATRLALGARYRQILTQLGAEGILIAVISAIAGLVVAQSAIRMLVRWAPGDIPRLPQAALNLESFGSPPGLRPCALWRARWFRDGQPRGCSGVHASRRRDTIVGSRSQGRMRYVFVMAHSAVTVVLLVLASLLVLSYRAMMSADIGFANRDALSMNLQLHGPGLFSAQAFDAKYRRSFIENCWTACANSPE